jgi:hypothetical protein
MPAPNIFIGKIGDDPFDTSIELGRYRDVRVGQQQYPH